MAGGRIAGEQPPASPGLLAIQSRTPGQLTEVGGWVVCLLPGFSAWPWPGPVGPAAVP